MEVPSFLRREGESLLYNGDGELKTGIYKKD